MNIRYGLVTVWFMVLAGCSTTNSRVVTRLNTEAVLAGNLPVNLLRWRVMTSGVDLHNTTMFTVFGNDTAVQYARTNAAPTNYPAGSVIALATWHQQEDSRWLGGRIPARALSVEFVEVRPLAEGVLSNVYQVYEGYPLQEIMIPPSRADRRAAYILSLRAAVMP